MMRHKVHEEAGLGKFAAVELPTIVYASVKHCFGSTRATK